MNDMWRHTVQSPRAHHEQVSHSAVQQSTILRPPLLHTRYPGIKSFSPFTLLLHCSSLRLITEMRLQSFASLALLAVGVSARHLKGDHTKRPHAGSGADQAGDRSTAADYLTAPIPSPSDVVNDGPDPNVDNPPPRNNMQSWVSSLGLNMDEYLTRVPTARVKPAIPTEVPRAVPYGGNRRVEARPGTDGLRPIHLRPEILHAQPDLVERKLKVPMDDDIIHYMTVKPALKAPGDPNDDDLKQPEIYQDDPVPKVQRDGISFQERSDGSKQASTVEQKPKAPIFDNDTPQFPAEPEHPHHPRTPQSMSEQSASVMIPNTHMDDHVDFIEAPDNDDPQLVARHMNPHNPFPTIHGFHYWHDDIPQKRDGSWNATNSNAADRGANEPGSDSLNDLKLAGDALGKLQNSTDLIERLRVLYNTGVPRSERPPPQVGEEVPRGSGEPHSHGEQPSSETDEEIERQILQLKQLPEDVPPEDPKYELERELSELVGRGDDLIHRIPHGTLDEPELRPQDTDAEGREIKISGRDLPRHEVSLPDNIDTFIGAISHTEGEGLHDSSSTSSSHHIVARKQHQPKHPDVEVKGIKDQLDPEVKPGVPQPLPPNHVDVGPPTPIGFPPGTDGKELKKYLQFHPEVCAGDRGDTVGC